MNNKEKLKFGIFGILGLFALYRLVTAGKNQIKGEEADNYFFKNKVVWLTGASSGIGEALTYALDRRGAKIIISSRRREALRQVRERCLNKDNIYILPMDITDLDSIPEKVKEALGQFGHIDILLNNAGVSQRALAEETELEIDQELMQSNYFGPVALTKALLPSMSNRKKGHIVVVSSVVGKFGTPLRTGYAASKHALHGFFDSLRAEIWHNNILVTIVCPGFIKTNISANAYTKDKEKYGNVTRGMDAGLCAEKILRGIAKEKDEFLVGGYEKAGVYIKNIAPSVFSKWIKKAKVV